MTKIKRDPHNANKGTKKGRALVERSLAKLGAGRSIVVDKSGTVIAGNTTLSAAEKLDLPVRVVETTGDELVVVQRTDLDLDDPIGKARQLAYADNRASELGLAWDSDVLKEDTALGLDLDDLGLSIQDVDVDKGKYTDKIKGPTYKITGEKPGLSSLYDLTKYNQLLAELDKADIPQDEKDFLRFAATRHIVFNYAGIAEYYAHTNSAIQRLFEKSALVIIDFDDAIEFGYAKLTKRFAELSEEQKS